MSNRSRQAGKRRSSEVYRSLSEPDPVIPKANPKKASSEGSLISDDLKFSWHQKVWFNLRSFSCFGKPMDQLENALGVKNTKRLMYKVVINIK